MRKPGGMSDLKDILGRWKPWIPPKQDQAFQQVCVCGGGAVVGFYGASIGVLS
jgi:hypothetical protein